MSELAELIRRAMEHRLADVRTSMPVRVETYNLATQTVDVVPLVREITETDDDDIKEALPVIPSVPVAFPRAGGFFVTFPIIPGDTGQIVICDRSIDQWRTRGSDSYTPDFGYAVDPLDRRRHGLAGAVFYPGLSDSLSPLLDAHATDMVLGQDSGSSIHFKPTSEVHVGSAPTDFVALAAAVATELTRIQGELNAHKAVFDIHTHILAIAALAGAGGTGTAAPPVAPFAGGAAPASVAATKVKAD